MNRASTQMAERPSSNIHNYFLRSASSTVVVPSQYAASSEASGSPRSDRSAESPDAHRTIKKKPSIWNIFSRTSKKKESGDVQAGGMSISNVSSMSVNVPVPRVHQIPVQSRSLRSQQSMHTLRSQTSIPTLRSARSQYALRRPSGMQVFEDESMFSDESEGEVSVSWVTSTGLRRAGLDDDDDETMGLAK